MKNRKQNSNDYIFGVDQFPSAFEIISMIHKFMAKYLRVIKTYPVRTQNKNEKHIRFM